MSNQLGGFTTYGIEYLYDFLGQERIAKKIDETKDTPTMGVKFVDFVNGSPDYTYYHGTGVFWIFHYLILQYFDEFDVCLFLFESSKKYSEENYFNSGLLKYKWPESQKAIVNLDSNMFNNDYKADKMENPFWIELHYLYQELLPKFLKYKNIKLSLSTDFEGDYILEKKKLISSIVLEVKTKRKPLTGQYLLYREADVFYNLDPLEISTSIKSYKFIKDQGLYILFINEEANSAKIVREGVKNYSKTEELLLGINIDELIVQLGDIYLNNFGSISKRFKLSRNAFEGKNLLGNALMMDLSDYYQSVGNFVKAKSILELNNSYPDVWRGIDDFEEE